MLQVISLCPSQYFFSYSYVLQCRYVQGIFCSVCILSLPECVVSNTRKRLRLTVAYRLFHQLADLHLEIRQHSANEIACIYLTSIAAKLQ